MEPRLDDAGGLEPPRSEEEPPGPEAGFAGKLPVEPRLRVFGAELGGLKDEDEPPGLLLPRRSK